MSRIFVSSKLPPDPELVRKRKEFVLSEQKFSVNKVRMSLNVGFAKTMELLNLMQEEGIVSYDLDEKTKSYPVLKKEN